MQITTEDRRTIYRALDAEVEKLERAYKKAKKAYSATSYTTAAADRELLSIKERQARAAYRAAFEVAAQYFDTYLMND